MSFLNMYIQFRTRRYPHILLKNIIYLGACLNLNCVTVGRHFSCCEENPVDYSLIRSLGRSQHICHELCDVYCNHPKELRFCPAAHHKSFHHRSCSLEFIWDNHVCSNQELFEGNKHSWLESFSLNRLASLKPTARTWKWIVGRWRLSFWSKFGRFSGVNSPLVLGSVSQHLHSCSKFFPVIHLMWTIFQLRWRSLVLEIALLQVFPLIPHVATLRKSLAIHGICSKSWDPRLTRWWTLVKVRPPWSQAGGNTWRIIPLTEGCGTSFQIG